MERPPADSGTILRGDFVSGACYRRTLREHLLFPPFAECAKNGAPTCIADAGEIKSLGHGGCPTSRVFCEKWGFRLSSRGDFHLQHRPVIHPDWPRFATGRKRESCSRAVTQEK